MDRIFTFLRNSLLATLFVTAFVAYRQGRSWLEILLLLILIPFNILTNGSVDRSNPPAQQSPPQSTAPPLRELATAFSGLGTGIAVVSSPEGFANLRKTPDFQANNTITTLPNGTELEVLAQDRTGEWSNVRETTQAGFVREGWIYRNLLQYPSQVKAYRRIEVNKSDGLLAANFRSQPIKQKKYIVAVLHNGMLVAVLDTPCVNGWCQVTIPENQQVGWVWEEFLR